MPKWSKEECGCITEVLMQKHIRKCKGSRKKGNYNLFMHDASIHVSRSMPMIMFMSW